jgi:hypothetical protein
MAKFAEAKDEDHTIYQIKDFAAERKTNNGLKMEKVFLSRFLMWLGWCLLLFSFNLFFSTLERN